tara:strand:- start:1176 stop:1421 length:246 start_codon:yes stop_codon:yes gene_type:complete
MTVPNFYIVADGNAYAMEEDGYMFGAPVKMDGSPDWDASYDFDFERGMSDEEAEYVIHICNLLKQTADLTKEMNNNEVFVK